MWLLQIFFFLFFLMCDSVIYYLNDTEFNRMPPVFHLDQYETCLYANNASGVYCHAEFDLVTDTPSGLYQMIQEYSERTETHLNHTHLSYGICLTKTCKDYYKNNTTGDRKSILETCLNESLWKDYKLKAKIRKKKFSCTTAHDEPKIDELDIVVAFILLTVIGFSLVGSLREIYYGTDKCQKGKDFLTCFSIFRNWARLTETSDGPDLRLSKLRFLQGTKGVITNSVYAAHLLYMYFVNIDNTSAIDGYYRDPLLQEFIHGMISMHIFFAISGFLLAYNFEVIAEKHKMSSAFIPLAIFHRWLRLFSPLVVFMAFYTTWIRHLSSGPLWESLVGFESQACRRDWWKKLLFIHNYFDTKPPDVACAITTWYLGADFQLYILGVLSLVLTTGLQRKILLGVMIFSGFAMVAAYTYYYDLDGAIMTSPETLRELFLDNPAFNHVYIRGHTNIAPYFAGIASGLAAFHLTKTGFKLQRYRLLRHRYLLMIASTGILSAAVTYNFMIPDGPRPSLSARVAYAVFSKVAILICTSLYLVGMVLVDNDYAKNFMSWSGWAVPSRVSLSAYIIHFAIIQVLVGSRTTLQHSSRIHFLETIFGGLGLVFMGAVLFHLLFEAPSKNLVKLYILPSREGGTANQHAVSNGKNRSKKNNSKELTRTKGE